MPGLPDNVFYDSASAYRWADLNETLFLETVLNRLRHHMGPAFSEYAFFVLSSHRSAVRPASLTDTRTGKVLIFISDESSSAPNHLATHYDAIFKAYLPNEMPGTNISPFNVGYVRDVPAHPVRPVAERSVDVFFSGNLSRNRLGLYRSLHPVYRRLPPSLLRLIFTRAPEALGSRLISRDRSRALPSSFIRFTEGFKEGLTGVEYGRMLAESRIVLCPMGARSPETFRHIEAMRAGAVVVSGPLPDTHFYRGSPIVTVRSWMEGIARTKRLLSDPHELADLQAQTVAWWESVCSEDATARYMAKRLGAS